jgi:hypothetical protein
MKTPAHAATADTASRPHALTDGDDRRHRLEDSPLARESLIFLLFLPEENVGVIAYTWVDGKGDAGSMGLVFGPDDERYARFHVEGVRMSPDADFDDWTVGPMHVSHGAPHQEAHVTFEHEGVSLDYQFTASTPAFTYHDNPDGCPPFLADNRLEQSGVVRGTLTIGDRVIPFDTTGHRDHSWGTRDWTAFHHYKWINIQAPGIAINLMHGLAMDQLWQLGYVDRDGQQSPIVSIEAHVERDAEFWSYTSVDLSLVDALGRTTEVTAGHRTSLAVWPAGGLQSHDAAGPCVVAGVPGLIHVEEGWRPDFVAQRKAVASAAFDTEAGHALLSTNRAVGAAEKG